MLDHQGRQPVRLTTTLNSSKTDMEFWPGRGIDETGQPFPVDFEPLPRSFPCWTMESALSFEPSLICIMFNVITWISTTA